MLKGKAIVITGASRGIGRAIATLCAREGANVAINYRDHKAEATALAKQLEEEFGVTAIAVYFDVRDASIIANAVSPLLDDSRFAPRGRIDGWVNNAGVNLPGLLLSQTDEMIEAQIETNILGPIYSARFILPQMIEHQTGVILNIGSITRYHVAPGQSVYAATKGALASFTRALAKEYGRKGIRVNCIEPGPTDTDMLRGAKALQGDEIKRKIPRGRLGTPEEIAEFAVFLLSDRASFISGGIFTADGGYSLG